MSLWTLGTIVVFQIPVFLGNPPVDWVVELDLYIDGVPEDFFSEVPSG